MEERKFIEPIQSLKTIGMEVLKKGEHSAELRQRYI